jgi:hypothetical protein
MKKLLMLPLLVLLTGCVTYYYPETALEDGVYYAEDDPSYVVYSDAYAGTPYYPWSSLDYFYLGFNPYPSSYGGGFSIGISYGYSPWYYPYSGYGYYSPWYTSHYHHPYYAARRPYNRYYSQHNRGHYQDKRNFLGNRYDRYAGDGDGARRNRTGEDVSVNEHPSGRSSSDSASPTHRYVSTAPSGYSGNQGMVIRSRESKKTGKSQLQPDQSAPLQAVSGTPSNSPVVQPDSHAQRAGNEVRRRSDTKQTRSRTHPVGSSPSSSRQRKSKGDGSSHREGRK